MDVVAWFTDPQNEIMATSILCAIAAFVLKGLWWLFTRIEIPGILERDKI